VYFFLLCERNLFHKASLLHVDCEKLNDLRLERYTADPMYTGDNICVSRDYDKILEHVDVAFNGT